MQLPACELLRPDGSVFQSSEFSRSALAIVTYSFACPFARAYNDRLFALAERYADKAHLVLVVCSDVARFPQDRITRGVRVPPHVELVRDATELFVRSLGARVTPEAFVFNADRALIYQGRIDDSPLHPAEVAAPYLANAIEAAVRGGAPPASTKAAGTAIGFR